jgi:2-oxoglutarate dehydrogenase E1 component
LTTPLSPSFLMNMDPVELDRLFDDYTADPNAVHPSFKIFFDELESYNQAGGATAKVGQIDESHIAKEIAVRLMIYGYRSRAHFKANTNPIRQRRDRKENIDLAYFKLSDADYDTKFWAGGEIGLPYGTLRQIERKLRETYIGSIGFEYNHIKNPDQRKWVRAKAEDRPASFGLTSEQRLRIQDVIMKSVQLEASFDLKYPKKKRFSLQGGESVMGGLDLMMQTAVDLGTKEVILGMAHRGRLNALAHMLGKPYELLFEEMNGHFRDEVTFGSGDVKYHKGYQNEISLPGNRKLAIKMMPNPSHLETVNPVVLGFTRARQDIKHGSDRKAVLPVLMHGDAALAGQGIGYELAQFTNLPGYTVGGTIHIVINNQVGFTTDWEEGRTSDYCTALASITNSPVFHVNGDDADAVAYVMKTAIEYRQAFENDVFIDMVCYRKHGHNEGEEPKFTQPEMYKIIEKHPNPFEVYSTILDKAGIITSVQSATNLEAFKDHLTAKFDHIKGGGAFDNTPNTYFDTSNSIAPADVTNAKMLETFKTGLDKKRLADALKLLVTIPNQQDMYPKLAKLLAEFEEMVKTDSLSYGMAEILAFATLMQDKNWVRLSGQDSERGTFNHLHAVVYHADYPSNNYSRLSPFETDGQKAQIYNSLLSEYGVLGYEYGFSLFGQEHLTIWEAQFGDFCNGAQMIIDQYIAAGEYKWLQQSSVVMMLPHGYENQGSEHSSARLERFLQLCSDDNMYVVNVTTAANTFHLLRRQALSGVRKPLIWLTPKKNFKSPADVNASLEDLKTGTSFKAFLEDPSQPAPTAVKKVMYCSGKLYYELVEARKTRELTNEVAIVRLEQVYPTPYDEMKKQRIKYPKAKHIWVQEEPINNGAWTFLDRREHRKLFEFDDVVARPDSPSPAVGSEYRSQKEQVALLEKAFTV